MGWCSRILLLTYKKVKSERIRSSFPVHILISNRYFNSDFVFLSVLRKRNLQFIKVSYDIACLWSINLFSRAMCFPEDYRLNLSKLDIETAIPKFHLPAHGSRCWSRYSINYLKNWARVDGEAIERLWSTTNPIATSTREMTPGARRDFLEDRWGASNFRKIIELGSSLSKKLRTAVNGRRQHSRELEEFTSAFDPGLIRSWKEKIDAWNLSPDDSRDPYQALTRGKYSRRCSKHTANPHQNTRLQTCSKNFELRMTKRLVSLLLTAPMR